MKSWQIDGFLWVRRWRAQLGQGLVEYALILVLVVLIVIILISVIGPWTGNIFSNVINFL